MWCPSVVAMRVWGGTLLTALVFAGLVLPVACEGSGALPTPSELRSPGAACRFEQRSRRVCAALAQVSLLRPDGARVPMRPLGCMMDLRAGYVRWSIPELLPEPFDVVIRFLPPDQGGMAIAVEVEQVLYEWPCGERCLPQLLVQVPVVDTCSDRPSERTVSVPLWPATMASCVGESWSFGSDARWCAKAPEPGYTAFYVHRWTTRPMGLAEAFRLDLSSDGADARLDVATPRERAGSWVVAAESVRSKLDAVGSTPNRVKKTCRDGDRQLVEIRSADSWKVVVVDCASPLVDLRHLPLVRANEGPGYSGPASTTGVRSPRRTGH